MLEQTEGAVTQLDEAADALSRRLREIEVDAGEIAGVGGHADEGRRRPCLADQLGAVVVVIHSHQHDAVDERRGRDAADAAGRFVGHEQEHVVVRLAGPLEHFGDEAHVGGEVQLAAHRCRESEDVRPRSGEHPGSSVRPVAELAHRVVDPLPGGRGDGPLAGESVGDGADRDSGSAGHVVDGRHRSSCRTSSSDPEKARSASIGLCC
nr:hypothetical protein [Rathayibacter tanaceti]